jgi:hypothetical protein
MDVPSTTDAEDFSSMPEKQGGASCFAPMTPHATTSFTRFTLGFMTSMTVSGNGLTNEPRAREAPGEHHQVKDDRSAQGMAD